MKKFEAYHKGTDVLKFLRKEFSNGFWSERTYDENGKELTYKNSYGYCSERTYDENGNQLTFKDSNGYYSIKEKQVTKEDFEAFTNPKPCEKCCCRCCVK